MKPKFKLCLLCSKHHSEECKEIYVKKDKCDFFLSIMEKSHGKIDNNHHIINSLHSLDSSYISNKKCPDCGSNEVRKIYGNKFKCDKCLKIFE